MLLKVRSLPHLATFRRAGMSFTPTSIIVECSPDQAAAILADTRSLIASEVTVAEAEAFRVAQSNAITDPDGLAAENLQLKSRQSALEARVTELETALRQVLAKEGYQVEEPFGDEPSGGRGVKASIAPGSKGKARSEG